MKQYCRYCQYAHYGDWVWCDIKENLISTDYAKRTNQCPYFELNPVDVFLETDGYKPRKPKEPDGKQIKIF